MLRRPEDAKIAAAADLHGRADALEERNHRVDMVERVVGGALLDDCAQPDDHPANRDQLEHEHDGLASAEGRRHHVVDQDEAEKEREALRDVVAELVDPTRVGEIRRHDAGDEEQSGPSKYVLRRRTLGSIRSEASQTTTTSATTTRYSSRLNGRLPGSAYRLMGTNSTTRRIRPTRLRH